jgi:hypothetical protein
MLKKTFIFIYDKNTVYTKSKKSAFYSDLPDLFSIKNRSLATGTASNYGKSAMCKTIECLDGMSTHAKVH